MAASSSARVCLNSVTTQCEGTLAWAWQAVDGTTYDTEAVAALCLTLLETQIGDGAPAAE